MSGGLTLADRYRGRWYVRYPEGQRSIGMTLSVARTYRRLFGGKVHHETWWLFRETPHANDLPR